MELTARQNELLTLIQRNAPITGEMLAEMLGVSRPTLRSDLAILAMLGLVEAKPKVGYFPGKKLQREMPQFAKVLDLRVKDVMSLPQVVRNSATVSDAAVMIFMQDVGSLAVLDEEDLLTGVVSRKDLLKVLLAGGTTAAQLPIVTAMTRQASIITLDPEASLLEASRTLNRHHIDGVPVVKAVKDSKGDLRSEVVGRLTRKHLTMIFADLLESMAGTE
ncbi:CBS domain-containing protein [Paenibacillus sp. SC116]|uniref:CBS domain-containing protein n=1 Tax=Paenibacillus sp. SC116 TaxID=2968986 RepID=UPI002811A4BB|nr:CBS domain-containing protein [Paenibacillus sp. SC116]